MKAGYSGGVSSVGGEGLVRAGYGGDVSSVGGWGDEG